MELYLIFFFRAAVVCALKPQNPEEEQIFQMGEGWLYIVYMETSLFYDMQWVQKIYLKNLSTCTSKN